MGIINLLVQEIWYEQMIDDIRNRKPFLDRNKQPALEQVSESISQKIFINRKIMQAPHALMKAAQYSQLADSLFRSKNLDQDKKKLFMRLIFSQALNYVFKNAVIAIKIRRQVKPYTGLCYVFVSKLTTFLFHSV